MTRAERFERRHLVARVNLALAAREAEQRQAERLRRFVDGAVCVLALTSPVGIACLAWLLS
jgi:hypothetical protein